MKPFQFTLQAILTLRQQKEQRSLELYAAALAARRLAAAERDAARHHLERARTDLRQQLSTARAAAQIAQSHDYSRLLEVRLHQANQQLAAAEQSVSQTLQSMVDARQQCELVETLRNRRLQQHSAQSRRFEERLLDDLAGRRVPVGMMDTKPVRAFL